MIPYTAHFNVLKKFVPLLFAALLFLACKSDKKQKKVKKNKPNILFIGVDDLRPELNFYGANHVVSPYLDDLASESTVFNRAYCNVPVCGASRASLLTGSRPTRHRFVNYKTKKDVDMSNAVSLPMVFRRNGYTTISNGKIFHHNLDDKDVWNEIWHPEGNIRNYQLQKNIDLNEERITMGYPYVSADVHDSVYFDGRIANKGIHDLRKLKNSGGPFFIALGFMKPHLPFNAPKKYWELYNEKEISLPENYKQPETKPRVAYHNSFELRGYHEIPKEGGVSEETAIKMLHGYYACVSYVDAQIGRILNELEILGLAENTIIVLWGDHGYNLGVYKMWCKHCTFNSSIQTPLVVKVPGMTKGEKPEGITEFVDIYPSLCKLAGIEAPTHLEGESFVPLLNGGTRKKDYAVSKFKDAVALIKGDLFYTEWTDDQGEA